MTTRTIRTLPALALLAALALPTALAGGSIRVDASAAPFPDAVAAMGVDLAWDGDLVLVLAAEGVGALGDAIVPVVDADGLPTDALGRVVADEAVARSGVVVAESGGVRLVLDGSDARHAAEAFAERLAALGFEIESPNGGRVVTAQRDGRTFRATFAVHDAGVAVYLGEL
jgi:hypothetical protein